MIFPVMEEQAQQCTRPLQAFLYLVGAFKVGLERQPASGGASN
jgi:hypothetical protein